jgi:ion channel-forming bestrophin family protein
MLEPRHTETHSSTSGRRSLWAAFLAFWPPLPVWRRLDAAVVALAAYTALVVLVVSETAARLPDWSGVSTILNALVLGLLLGFRTQVAYDRWWEGRRLWGQLINDARSLCAKAAALPDLSASARAELGRLVPAFAVALKYLLRGEGGLRRVKGFESAEENPKHVPLFLFGRLTAVLQAERGAGRIAEMDILLLDPHVRGLMDVCGGCERIKNTSIPLSYRALLRHGLVLYLLSTPWLVADHLLWWTVPLGALLGYFLVGVELAAEHVEEPFGRDADDLTLSAYCETIRQSTEQAFG